MFAQNVNSLSNCLKKSRRHPCNLERPICVKAGSVSIKAERRILVYSPRQNQQSSREIQEDITRLAYVQSCAATETMIFAEAVDIAPAVSESERPQRVIDEASGVGWIERNSVRDRIITAFARILQIPNVVAQRTQP
jgi:hypothetical protein